MLGKLSRQTYNEGAIGSEAEKSEMDDIQGMEGCSQQPGLGHDSATPATPKDMAFSSGHNAMEMCANIKSEPSSLNHWQNSLGHPLQQQQLKSSLWMLGIREPPLPQINAGK